MTEFQLVNKKIKNLELTREGTFRIVETDQALMITDLLISKENDGRMIIQMNDGTNIIRVCYIDKAGTHKFTFPSGLTFWKGANLEVIKLPDANSSTGGVDIITVGYVRIDQSKTWEVFNGR